MTRFLPVLLLTACSYETTNVYILADSGTADAASDSTPSAPDARADVAPEASTVADSATVDASVPDAPDLGMCRPFMLKDQWCSQTFGTKYGHAIACQQSTHPAPGSCAGNMWQLSSSASSPNEPFWPVAFTWCCE